MRGKTRASLLSLLLIAALLLGGCGGSKSADSATEQFAVMNSSAAGDEAPASAPMERSEEAEASYDTGGLAVEGGTGAAHAVKMESEKIIYSATAEVETIDYEKAVEGVYAMVERYGGFVQSASVSGSNYYRTARGMKTLRSASFTLRIPSEHFTELTASLSELGNVPYCNTYSENVTAQYYDVSSRLDAYKTQEARLLEMLSIAETVEDMLAIQQQLTEVQYEIDSLSSRLTNYDRQVSYSTVDLTLSEVEEYTETPVVVLSYWEKMGQGFRRSLRNVGEFFTDSFLFLVSHLPALTVWAVGLGLGWWLLRRCIRRRREKSVPGWKARRAAEKAESEQNDDPSK